MATRQKRNNPFAALLIPTLCSGAMFYFIYGAFNGDLGIHSSALMDRKILSMQYELARLKIERQTLEHRVKMLRDGTIESDMLDQLARENLNLGLPDEWVIMSSQ